MKNQNYKRYAFGLPSDLAYTDDFIFLLGEEPQIPDDTTAELVQFAENLYACHEACNIDWAILEIKHHLLGTH